MKTFFITPEARQEMMDIWDHIANDNLDAADRILDQLEEAFAKLGEMPGMGHFREELLDRRYKFWSIHSYVIAYRWDVLPIQVIAVVHGALWLEAFFYDRAP